MNQSPKKSLANRLTANQRLLYQLIRTQERVSRADLVRVSGLTFPSVSRMVGELIKGGFVQETQQRRGGMGKPPTELAVRSETTTSLGVTFYNDCLYGVRIDASGRIEAQLARPATREDLIDATLRMAEALKVDPSVVGLGIISEGNTPEVEEVEMLTRTLNLPVHGQTLAGAAALLERYFGAGRGVSDFVLLETSSVLATSAMVGDRLIAHANQLTDLTQLIDGNSSSSNDGVNPFSGSLPALMALIVLVRPQALIVGGELIEAHLQELTAQLKANAESIGVQVELRQGLENPTRLALAAATLPLYAEFASPVLESTRASLSPI